MIGGPRPLELDVDLVVPDQAKSIQDGAVEPWTKPHYRAQLAELKKAARARGIPVSNIPVYGTDAVAEYVMALVLGHYRQPHLHGELVKKGEWSRAGDWSFWRTPLAPPSQATR